VTLSLPQAELSAAATDPLDPIAAALFCPMGVAGVYARTAIYESIVDGINRFISRERDPRAEVLCFPPVMSREQVEKSGYLTSFPNLLGCVCALHGSENAIRSAAESYYHGGDWTQSLGASDLVLSPAACYPVYPLAASRGPVPPSGLLFDVAAECFRREPSRALNRLQSFRMREFVCIGMPQEILAFRENWMARAETLARELALPCTLDVASDPFFGRVGQIMAVSQRQQSLKFELLIRYRPGAEPTACMSFNYHRDHFGVTWALADKGGNLVHTSCVAFGIDRLAVALFCIHGVDPTRWPASVRSALAV
jgi:seryl-tRNA synthetase